MLYLATLFLLVAVALMGADLAGVRAFHSAGVTGTLFLVAALVLLALKEFRVFRQDHAHRHG